MKTLIRWTITLLFALLVAPLLGLGWGLVEAFTMAVKSTVALWKRLQ